jgi:hypothetical protein
MMNDYPLIDMEKVINETCCYLVKTKFAVSAEMKGI